MRFSGHAVSSSKNFSAFETAVITVMISSGMSGFRRYRTYCVSRRPITRPVSRRIFMCRDIWLWLASSRSINSQTQCSLLSQRMARALRPVELQRALSICCIVNVYAQGRICGLIHVNLKREKLLRQEQLNSSPLPLSAIPLGAVRPRSVRDSKKTLYLD